MKTSVKQLSIKQKHIKHSHNNKIKLSWNIRNNSQVKGEVPIVGILEILNSDGRLNLARYDIVM